MTECLAVLLSGRVVGHLDRAAPETTPRSPTRSSTCARARSHSPRACPKVERSVALSIGGERVASRIRRHQLRKAARTLGLDAELLIGRLEMLTEAFLKAFEESLEKLAGSVPGVREVAERTLSVLQAHTRHILDRLGDPAGA